MKKVKLFQLIFSLLILFDVIDRWSAKENALLNFIIVTFVAVLAYLVVWKVAKPLQPAPANNPPMQLTPDQLYFAFLDYKQELLAEEEYEEIKEIDNILSQLELGIISETVHRFDYGYNYVSNDGQNMELQFFVLGRK